MASLYTPPNGARVLSSFAPGDRIDIVNWPSVPVNVIVSLIPANTMLVMPFFSDYVLRYDSIRVSYSGTAQATWGLYSYEPSNRSGSLLNATGASSLSGTDVTSDINFPQGILYPGRVYALAVNSSADWNMNVFFGNGASSSRILGFDWVGNNPILNTHLRAPLTYNATLPASLPSSSLDKSNLIWPPNPLFRAV
jgi:hypothetical protein